MIIYNERYLHCDWPVNFSAVIAETGVQKSVTTVGKVLVNCSSENYRSRNNLTK